MRWLLPLLAGVLLASCGSPPREVEVADSGLDTLARWMTGSFSSAMQAAEDPDNFRDVRLHMAPIWTARRDGPWLYIEQAMASSPDKPYRQRVYRLSRSGAAGDETYESAVYELPGDPLRFTGAWRSPSLLDPIRPDMLVRREGCSIVLRRSDDAFIGSTVDRNCSSTLRGASYATSEVTIMKDRLISWDRGFDDEGNQKWGAETGGYVFMKENPQEDAPQDDQPDE